MIKFKFTSAKKADNDGEFGLLFEVLAQDENQIAKGLGVYSFQASNGWAVKSNKGVAIKTDDKTVWIKGTAGDTVIMGLVSPGSDTNWFKTEAEMFTVMKDVSDAIAEWAKAGGFPQVADFDVKNFSF